MRGGLCTIAFLLLTTFYCKSQLVDNTKNTAGYTKMDLGANAMIDGKYEEADLLLREALAILDKLPSELAYYFGRNSYHLGKYKQAINWLNKYIELKGTGGQYFDQAIKYLELSNTEYLVIRQLDASEAEEQIESNSYIECQHDNVVCPVCKGSGVLITSGTFDPVYSTCPYSGLDGMLTCEQYNLFLKGQLEPNQK